MSVAGPLPQFAAAMNRAMPRVKRLKAYVKDRRDIQYIAVTWPKLEGLTLVRWHEFVVGDTAVNEEPGSDAGIGRRAGVRISDGQSAVLPSSIAPGEQQVPELLPLLHACCFLRSLDLSEFFCFTEHVVEAVTFAATAGMRAAATAEWDARRREEIEKDADMKRREREARDGCRNGGTLVADVRDETHSGSGNGRDANEARQGAAEDGREGEHEVGERRSGGNDESDGSSSGGCDGGFDLNVDPNEQIPCDEALQVHHSAASDRVSCEAYGHISSFCHHPSDGDNHAGRQHQPWSHSIWTPATLMFGCSSLVPPFPLSHPPLHALTNLDLLKLSPSAFTHRDVCAIALSLPSLLSFRCLCDFDPRVADCVRDETLIAIAASCMHLQRLYLSDCVAWAAPPLSDAPDELDALITPAGILAMASGLASLHSLTVTPSHNVRGGEAVLLELMSVSPQLREVHVGRLICSSLGANESLDLPPSLSVVSLAQCSSLPPSLLPTLAQCCPALTEVAFWSCPDITPAAMKKLCAARRGTLRRVTAVNCHHLPTPSLLRALQPIQASLLSLCCSLDWRQPALSLTAPSAALSLSRPGTAGPIAGTHRTLASSPAAVAAAVAAAVSSGSTALQHVEQPSEWPSLESLELMAPLGALLAPLADSSLLTCPRLTTVKIRVYGDCRLLAGPGARAFGLSSLQRHPRLHVLHLDLGGVVGHSLSCPPGFTDVMTWERFFLHGLQLLPACEELHYVPPADCDLGRRSMSLPSAGILASCSTLRCLYLHCAASEHLLSLLLRQVGGGGGSGPAQGRGGAGAGSSSAEDGQQVRPGHLRDLCIINDSFPASRDDAATGIRAMALQRLLAEVDGRGWQH